MYRDVWMFNFYMLFNYMNTLYVKKLLAVLINYVNCFLDVINEMRYTVPHNIVTLIHQVLILY